MMKPWMALAERAVVALERIAESLAILAAVKREGAEVEERDSHAA